MRKYVSWVVDAAIVVAAIGAVSFALRQRVPDGTIRLAAPTWQELAAGGTDVGASSGDVTVVEFIDYQCPVCARVEKLLDRLDKEYPGRIRRVVRHFPIESIHPQARISGLAVECARQQGRVDRMHRLLLAEQVSLKEVSFDTLARPLAIPDSIQFASCLVSKAAADRIDADVELAHSLGVSSTPTLIIDGLFVTSLSPPLLLSLVRSRLD